MGMRSALSRLSNAFRRSARFYEQRGTIRRKARGETAVLRVRGREEIVRLCNISQTGMMAETTMAPHIGERIEVVLDGHGRVGAMVRWYVDGRIGVKFDAPLPLR